MSKKIKKIKNPYLLFAPILFGIIIVFLLDWVTGPHSGAIHPPIEYCGHTRASARIGSIPHFHCAGDQYPLLFAVLRYVGFLGVLAVAFPFFILLIMLPLIIFGYIKSKTKKKNEDTR